MKKGFLRSLLSDSFIYGVSGVIASFISIFLIPLYTRVFEPADYGVISILTTSSAFLNILLIFSLDNSAAVWFWDKTDQKEREVTFNTWIVFLGICGLFLMLLIVLFSGPLSYLFFESSAYKSLFVLIGLNLLFVGFQKVVNIWCRMLRKPVLAMVYSLLIMVSTVICNVFFILYLKLGVRGVFYSQLIAGFIGFILLIVFFRRWINPMLFSQDRLKAMLHFSLPLVPATLLYWIMNMASIYFIKLFVNDNAEIGLYQVGASVANILSLCTWAFFQAWTPLALEVSKNENAPSIYSQVFKWYCFLGFTFAFLLLFFAKDILIVFTREAYLGAWQVIGLLGINVIVLGIPNILAIANAIVKKNRSYAIAMGIGAIVTVGLFFVLIPMFGKEGAVFSMIIGNLTMCIVLGYKTQKLFYIPYDFISIIFFNGFSALVFIGLLQFEISFFQKIIISMIMLLFFGVQVYKSFKGKVTVSN